MKTVRCISSYILHCVILFNLLCVSQNVFAQRNPKPTVIKDPNTKYGEGGTRIAKTTTTQKGNRTEETIKDQNGTIREVTIRTSDYESKIVTTLTEFFDCKGQITGSENIVKDEKINLVRLHEVKTFQNGSQVYGRTETDDGSGQVITKFNPQTRKYEPVPSTDTDRRILNPDVTICEDIEVGNGVEISGGYSLLNYDGEPDRINLHGFNLGAQLNLNGPWGIVLDGSGHYKKEGNTTLSKHLLQLGIRYLFSDQDNVPKSRFVHPFAHAMAGIAFFKGETDVTGVGKFETKEKSFAYTLGAGFDINIADNIAFRGQADYVHTGFNDGSQNNFRFGAGVIVQLNIPSSKK